MTVDMVTPELAGSAHSRNVRAAERRDMVIITGTSSICFEEIREAHRRD